jgi:hypothetical protein
VLDSDEEYKCWNFKLRVQLKSKKKKKLFVSIVLSLDSDPNGFHITLISISISEYQPPSASAEIRNSSKQPTQLPAFIGALVFKSVVNANTAKLPFFSRWR